MGCSFVKNKVIIKAEPSSGRQGWKDARILLGAVGFSLRNDPGKHVLGRSLPPRAGSARAGGPTCSARSILSGDGGGRRVEATVLHLPLRAAAENGRPGDPERLRLFV